jgi:hypothetical protein
MPTVTAEVDCPSGPDLAFASVDGYVELCRLSRSSFPQFFQVVHFVKGYAELPTGEFNAFPWMTALPLNFSVPALVSTNSENLSNRERWASYGPLSKTCSTTFRSRLSCRLSLHSISWKVVQVHLKALPLVTRLTTSTPIHPSFCGQ